MATLHDFSQKTDLRLLGTLINQIDVAAEGPYLLAGATARDLLLKYAYEIPTKRATTDVDLAFMLESWDRFETMRKRLIAGSQAPNFRATECIN